MVKVMLKLLRKNMIKAFGYARKSPDDKEGTESSILNQTKMIKKTVEERNWELIDIFIDKNISGSDRGRKGFNDMKRRAIAEKVEILAVKDQDRFARDHAFFSDTLQDLDAHQIRVFSILKNNFLSHEDLGDVVTAVVDSNMIVKSRIKTHQLYSDKKEEGLPSFVSSFGYKFPKGKNVVKNWIIKEREAEIVRQVCSDYLNKASLKETIVRLKINKPLYYRIIRTARKGIYNGWIFYVKKFKDSAGNIVRTEDVLYKGKHEPILDEKTFKMLNPDFVCVPDGGGKIGLGEKLDGE